MPAEQACKGLTSVIVHPSLDRSGGIPVGNCAMRPNKPDAHACDAHRRTYEGPEDAQVFLAGRPNLDRTSVAQVLHATRDML